MPSVLHLSTADNLGGSARSAYKIHTGLRALGLTSRMLVRTKVTDDPDVGYVDGGRFLPRLLDQLGRQVVDRLDLQYLYYPSSFALERHPWFAASDVLQLYNLHGGYFSYRALPRLSRERPAVWRLSDMWPLTGHCAYSYDCNRWKTGCGSCPLLGEYPGLRRDTTAFLWRVKERVYRGSRLVVVATNRWMEERVRESPLLGRFPLHRIPNGVATEVFRPGEKRASREALGVPPDARVVLFLAHVATTGTRKGGEHVPPVMERLAAGRVPELLLVVAGEGSASWLEGRGYRTLRIPFTRSEVELARLYVAADVLISPALAENLPNAVLEAMACGTPVAAFDSGGVADAVCPGETGYLAGYKDDEDLARGVQLLLRQGDGERVAMAARCRAVIEAEYSSELQAKRYSELYQALVARG